MPQDIDINTTISEVNLFIEKLQNEMPDVFRRSATTPLKKLLFKGKLHNVNLYKNDAESITFEDDIFKVSAPDFKRSTLKPVIEQWMKQKAAEIIPQKAAFWAQKMSVTYSKIKIKDQKSLWGSCSHKGNLNFCWRIIKAPEEVQDYLIIHELAHIKHKNHGSEFWQMVEISCPENKKCRKWLNQYKERLFINANFDGKENL